MKLYRPLYNPAWLTLAAALPVTLGFALLSAAVAAVTKYDALKHPGQGAIGYSIL